jgi:hypothetical protein
LALMNVASVTQAVGGLADLFFAASFFDFNIY